MLDTARRAMCLQHGKERADYDRDESLRLALAYLIQIIGEAAARVSAEFRQDHPEIPWRQIIGMRQKIVHDYLNVDEKIVWDVVTADLPPLAASLKPLVPSSE